jgi:hypothetical protein
MELRRCPKCLEREVRMLDVPSQHASVWYFLCNNCQHRWNVPKDDANGPPQVETVTPRKW